MNISWYSLPADILVVIFSLLEPHYYYLRVNRQIGKLKDRWLQLHFKNEFGLSSLTGHLDKGLRSQNYLSFYIDNAQWLQLGTDSDYRHLIRKFATETNQYITYLESYHNGYVHYLIDEFCDSMEMDTRFVYRVPLTIWNCTKCESRRSAKSYKNIVYTPCPNCGSSSYTEEEKEIAFTAIQITKRSSPTK